MLTFVFSFFLALVMLLPLPACPSTSTSVPPFIQVGAKPNIIVILDNSNSMDEDFYGNAVGSYSPASKSVVAKKALIDVIDIYRDRLRVGLVTYKINSPSAYYLHNSAYFTSYEPKSYCPNPPAECQAYCADDSNTAALNACNAACQADNPLFDATYRDEIITAYAANSEQRTRYCSLVYPKTQRMTNPTDTSNFVYYKMALPFYASSNWGTEFDYSSSYNPLEGSPYSSYSRYGVKTGTSDALAGYSSSKGSATFTPTDSDFALGFYDFGRRMYSYYASRTWFVNTSPNPAVGFRYVDVGELVVGGATTTTYSKIMTKLDPKENDETGYMSCKTQSSTDSCHIVNTGLTPTSGTFKTIIDYVKSSSTPIQGNCEKTFVIYVTDGLPSVNESGSTDTAEHLMPSVLSRIGELRNITVGGKNYDIQSYILGVGLSTPAKAKLDDMAQAGGTARAYDGSTCTNAGGCAYYADNASQLQEALAAIFSQVGQPVASAGAVATVSQEISSGDIVIRGAFRAYEETAPDVYVWYGHMESYWPFAGCSTLTEETKCTSVSGCQWNSGTSTCSGSDIYSFQIPNNQGKFCPDISSNGNCWDAGQMLAGTGSTGRDVFTYIETNTPKKTSFNSTSLSGSLLNNQLDLNGDNVTDSSDTEDLFDWVLGDNATNGRNRHGWILGDIIYSTPVVVGQPSLASVPRKIADAGCTGSCPNDGCFYCYRQDNQHRDQMVYVGANDGMLHAFTLGKWSSSAYRWIFNPSDNATLGTQLGVERWAYIPSNLLSELQTLANPLYGESSATQHRYMVDLSPQVWDMKIDHDRDDNATTPEKWRSVLVGGERGGGDVYFALDVTDPGNATVLGEFSVLKNYPASTDIVAGYTSHYDTLKKLTLAWSLPYAGRLLAPTYSNPNPYVAFFGGGVHEFRPDVADANATMKLMDLDGWEYLYYPSFHAVDLETGNDLWRNAWTSFLASTAYQAYFPLNSQMIQNPGFESGGGSLTSWSDTVGTGGSIAVETVDVHHGANAVKITAGSTPANTYLQQNITVVPGRQYQLYFWTRSDGGSYAGQYQIRNINSSSDIVAATSTTITGTSYQKVTKIFTAPAGCTSVGIRLRCPSSSGRAAYFDDVAVTPYPYMVMPYAVSNVAAFDVYNSAGFSITSGSAPDGYTDLLYAGDYNGTLFSVPINASGEQSVLPSCVVTRKTKTISNGNYNPYRGSRQPITVTPVAAIDETKGGGDLRVFFGTGKFDDVIMGENSDRTDNATMTFYCMVEDLDTRIGCSGNMTTIVPAATGSPGVFEKCRASSGSHHWVKWEFDNATSQNVTSPDGDGCFPCMLDFESAGERMLDSALVAAGYVFFTTFIPNEDSCSAGGTAYLYVLDYMCSAIETNPITEAGTMKYLDAKTGSWTTTEPGKIGAVRMSLGTGMPSRPVLDSTGESILIQTSDARLLKIGVDLGFRNKAKIKGWTYETN